jgi:hypothetical protein
MRQLREQAAEEARRRVAEQRHLVLLGDLEREWDKLKYYGETDGEESTNRGLAGQIAKFLAAVRAGGLGHRFEALRPSEDAAWTAALEVYRLCDRGDLDGATARLDEAEKLGCSWPRHRVMDALKRLIPNAILSPSATQQAGAARAQNGAEQSEGAGAAAGTTGANTDATATPGPTGVSTPPAADEQASKADQWCTVSEATRIAGLASSAIISVAANKRKLKSNGKKRRERRIDRCDLTRWIEERAGRPDQTESLAAVQKKLDRAKRSNH